MPPLTAKQMVTCDDRRMSEIRKGYIAIVEGQECEILEVRGKSVTEDGVVDGAVTILRPDGTSDTIMPSKVEQVREP